MARICDVDDCGKPHHSFGFCKTHSIRFKRHGDPLKRLCAANGEVPRYIEEVVLPHQGEGCLLWPYGKDSAGYARVNPPGQRGTILVSRLVCAAVHGEPPTPKHEAAHSCGKGSSGCVAPGHLSWKTRRENENDKFIHGTRQPSLRRRAA